MKTIAIVLNTSWNIYNFRLGLLRALQKEGYKIIAIAPVDDYSGKFEKDGIEFYPIHMNNKGTNPIEDLILIRKFYKIYKQVKPDVILHYTIKPNIYGTLAARAARVPVISNISGLGTVFLNDRLSSKIAHHLYRFALRFPKRVFFQNPHDRELFIKKKLVAHHKSDLLPGSGIDTQYFSPVEVEKASHEPFVFLLIARMVKDKGVVEFVEAAKQVKREIGDEIKVSFWLLGSLYPGNPTAITEDELKAWEKEGAVKYLGHTDDVMGMIAKSDCVVLPSYREGLSRVLLEAASMAKPIITTDTPGCRDVVDDGINGFLCHVKDTVSLAEQMKKMLMLPEDERKKMGQKGRNKVIHEFDEQIVIDKYREAIDQTLEECRKFHP